MNYDLSEIGIEKNIQYECITTTINKEGVKNAGAFAFTYLGEDKVFCRIFDGSKTLKNILDTNEYVVNITQDSLIFTYSTLSCFKGVYGMPPYTYLRTYRMERAAEMLRQGELSVSDIAATVGYGSPSKFTAAFKVLMGVTPSAYRRAEMKANKDFRLCTNGGMRAPVREQGL